MQRVYYDSQKEYLSVWSRLFLAVKVLGAVLSCGGALQYLIQACEFRTRLAFLPEVVTLLFLYGIVLLFVLLEVLVGYCIINIPILFLGYRPRKKSQWALFTTNRLQLPARIPIAIVEVPQKLEKDTGERREHASPLNQGQQPPIKSPTELQIVFSFFSRCVIRVKEVSSKVWKDLFLTMRQKAMLAYIAWNARKTPVFTEDVRKRFYKGLTANSLDRDKSDIKDVLQSVVESFGAIKEAVVLIKPSRGKGVYNTIALSDDCSLDIPNKLMFWHKQAWRGLLAQTADPIELAEFRIIYQRVIMEYGRGLFEENLTEALSNKTIAWWNWAIPEFKKHRAAQISFLDYCIRREEEESESMNDPYRREECLQQAAWLCKTASFTCATFDPELRQGERFLHHYLQLCRRLLKRDEALETYVEYEHQLQCYQIHWEPSSETQYLIAQLRKS